MRSVKAVSKIVWVIAAVVVIIVASIGVYFLVMRRPTVEKEIIIGSVLPLTGWASYYGMCIKFGQDIAVEEINAEGGIQSMGGAKLRIVYTDIKSDPAVTSGEVERLITTYHPHVLTGCYASSLTLVATEVSERYKVPFLVQLAVSPEITGRGLKYVFRFNGDAKAGGYSTVDFLHAVAEKEGIEVRTIACVYENTEYGQSQMGYVKERALYYGYEIVLDLPYPAGIKDADPLVLKIKEANADVVALVSYLDDAILITRALKKYDVNPLIFLNQGGGYSEPEFVKMMGKDADYFITVCETTADMPFPELEDFKRKYREKTGMDPGEAAVASYVTMWGLKEVLELAGQLHPDNPLDPDSIRDAFLNIDLSYPENGRAAMWPSKRVKLDETGNNIYNMQVVQQIIDGQFYTVYPFDLATHDYVFPIPKWSER